MRFVAILLVVLLIVFGTSFSLLAQEPPPPAPETALLPPDPALLADVLSRINAYRARWGVPPYQTHDALTRAAQEQADWLIITGSRRHYRPDGSRPSTRAFAYGFYSTHWCCGENYYMSIDAVPQMVFDFWRWSPRHIGNLISRDFTHIGLGMSSDGYRISYVMLAGQLDDPNAPPPPPAADAPPAAMPVVEQTTVETPPQPAVETPVAAALTLPSQTYYVVAGDNLSRIAARFGVTVAALMQANNLADANMIYAGQPLSIPAP